MARKANDPSITQSNNASSIGNKRGMARRAKRQSNKTDRQRLKKELSKFLDKVDQTIKEIEKTIKEIYGEYDLS